MVLPGNHEVFVMLLLRPFFIGEWTYAISCIVRYVRRALYSSVDTVRLKSSRIQIRLKLSSLHIIDEWKCLPRVQVQLMVHYITFEVSGIHFVMLNSYMAFNATSAQYKRLAADLARVDRWVTPWLVAGMHNPWYNSNQHHHKKSRRQECELLWRTSSKRRRLT